MQINVNLSETSYKVLSYVAKYPDEWVNNFVSERIRIAIDEIISIAIKKCEENKISIPSTRDEIVDLAFEQGWLDNPANNQPI